MRSFIIALALASVLAGCESSSGVDLAQSLALERHQELWAHRDFNSYSFDLAQQDLASTVNVRVIVQGTTVSSVIDKSTGEPLDYTPYIPTVDDLFANAIAAARNSGVVVTVEFNEQYGFPTLLHLQSKLNNPGGPYSAQLSNFTPLE